MRHADVEIIVTEGELSTSGPGVPRRATWGSTWFREAAGQEGRAWPIDAVGVFVGRCGQGRQVHGVSFGLTGLIDLEGRPWTVGVSLVG